MNTVRNKVFRFLKNRLTYIYVAAILFIIFIALLTGLITTGKYELASQIITLVVAGIALYVSVYTAITTSKSLKRTEEALELARNTTRPFLDVIDIYIEDAHEQYDAAIRVKICNSGSLPANNVSITVLIMEDWDNSGSRNRLNQDLLIPATCFPNIKEFSPSRHILYPEQYRMIDEMWAKVKIDYQNQNTGTIHNTTRGFRISGKEFIPDSRIDCWS